MASFLRSLVAGPRSRHPEADLDLCYVTSEIIATSGPSGTYPQKAYRNPLDKLVEFLDEKHGENWAIWEFRAEGTGYPDDLVYNRVRHYPWPDHHPPPFRLVPMMMASMRNWLHGGELHNKVDKAAVNAAATERTSADPVQEATADRHSSVSIGKTPNDRVVVVHCKAGKGRSGTVACSYLISECGWRPEEALTRFTERRMRPKFGAGVSIPSQLRTITYVDRWTRHGKRYTDRPIEIMEIHVWGLRDGVKVDVEGYVEDGRKIQIFHTFSKEERLIVEGQAPESGGVSHMLSDLAGVPVARAVEGAPQEADFSESTNLEDPNGEKARQEEEERKQQQQQKQQKPSFKRSASKKLGRTATLIQQAGTKATGYGRKTTNDGVKGQQESSAAFSSNQLDGYSSDSSADSDPAEADPGGMAVILKPSKPIRIPNSDVNLSVERRNRSPSSLGFTMVTAVAHVWFNTFFEGNGPEQDGKADENGVFSIDWDAMDGIKGSSRKGAKALDKVAVVWRVAGSDKGIPEEEKVGEEVPEPEEGKPVPEMKAADWKGGNHEEPVGRNLGLRPQNPASADISKASSVRSQDLRDADEREKKEGEAEMSDADSMAGVRSSGPAGEEELQGATGPPTREQKREEEAAAVEGVQQQQGSSSHKPPKNAQPGPEVLGNPDTANATTTGDSTEVEKAPQ